MRPYLILLLCLGRLQSWGTYSANVTTAGELHDVLANQSVADITVQAPLLFDPFLYCRETTTLADRQMSIAPATPSLFWDMYATSAPRLARLQLPGPCIRLESSSMYIQNGFELVSDVTVDSVDDLIGSFLAVFDVDGESDMYMKSVSFQIAPLSNLTALHEDVLERGGESYLVANVITVISLDVTPWHLENVRFTIAQNVTVSDSHTLQRVLAAGTVPYIVLTRDVSLEAWTNTTYVGTYVVITSSRRLIFDTAFKTAAVVTVRGGAIHIRGDITFTHSMPVQDGLAEGGLLPFVSLNTGTSIVDVTEIGGVLTIEDVTVYGAHTSVLWSPTFGSAYPTCLPGFVISYNSTAGGVDVRTLYVAAVTFFQCISNVSFTSESYRLLSNVGLPYGRGPVHVDTFKKYIPLVVVIGAALVLGTLALSLYVACKCCCRRDPCKDELGLGKTMREVAVATLGDVSLHELLGWGKYGRVYRATWVGREVAIKVGHPVRLTEDRDPLQDARLTESLQHANVVKALKSVYRDVEAAGGTREVVLVEPWFVMEYCDMGCLAAAIKRNVFSQKNSPKVNTILQTARDVTMAMAFLHDKGVLHGDLTCANIMLTKNAVDPRGFHVKVGDFGQAQTFARWSRVSMDAEVHGTVSHQSPEMLIDGTLSPAADVWAFGMVLFQLYTGQPPYSEYSDAQMIYVITTRKHLPPIPAHCPPDIKDIMQQCWQDAAGRPTFEQLSHKITALLRKHT